MAVGSVMALYSEYAKGDVHKFSPGKCSAHIHFTFIIESKTLLNQRVVKTIVC